MGVMNINNINSSLKGERFFVDTNIWILLTYIASKSFELSESIKSKISAYSAFIQKVKEEGGQIYTSSLCLSEIGHVIERKSFENYPNPNKTIKLKQYRNIQTERDIIVKDIDEVWDEIKSQATVLEHSINQQMGDQLITLLKNAPLDAYDAAFILAMKENRILNIITDDKDFQKVNSIDIYTL